MFYIYTYIVVYVICICILITWGYEPVIIVKGLWKRPTNNMFAVELIKKGLDIADLRKAQREV